VLPGMYTVNLRVDGRTYSKSVQVELDPRSDMTQAQLVAQYDAAIKMRDLTASVNRVVANVDELIRQTQSVRDQLRGAQALGGPGARQQGSPTAEALAEIDVAQRELRHFRDSVLVRPLAGLGYRQYPRLREEVQTVSGMITGPMFPATDAELSRMGELTTEAAAAQVRLDLIVQTRITKINTLLQGQTRIAIPRPAVVP
jgi:hypothetical protein